MILLVVLLLILLGFSILCDMFFCHGSYRINRMDTLHHFLETISAVPQVLDSFDEELWRATIEKVTVFHDGKMIFQFLDGTEIQG